LWVHVRISSHGGSALRQVLAKAFPEPGVVIDPSTAGAQRDFFRPGPAPARRFGL